jgi:uncharacterized protein (DUF302 family)
MSWMQTQAIMGLTTYLQTDFVTAVKRVTAALKSEGFGVLTEIDVKDTFKQKLDVDFRPYKILGACNPTLAHRALTTASEVGLLLPCNVTVTLMDDNRIQVAVTDPLVMMNVILDEELTAIAQQASERLNRVLEALQE